MLWDLMEGFDTEEEAVGGRVEALGEEWMLRKDSRGSPMKVEDEGAWITRRIEFRGET